VLEGVTPGVTAAVGVPEGERDAVRLGVLDAVGVSVALVVGVPLALAPSVTEAVGGGDAVGE